MAGEEADLRGAQSDLFDDAGRHVLENEVLPEFLRRQRWFRSKARELVSVRLVDWCKVGAGFHVTFVEMRYGETAGVDFTLDELRADGFVAVFVAVGAGHLPGEQGVLRLLREAGYTVEPVPPSAERPVGISARGSV